VLHELITAQHAEIVARTRAKRTERSPRRCVPIEPDEGIPRFLHQLSAALRLSRSTPGLMDEEAALCGALLLRTGCTVAEVVHCYGDVCQSVTELATELGEPIGTNDFRLFNGYLDDAIASALAEYGRLREAEIARTDAERIAALAHELRHTLFTAFAAFGSLRRGVVGRESSMGALLDRSLLRLQDLVNRSLGDRHGPLGVRQLQRVSVSALIRDVSEVAVVDATQRGVGFSAAWSDVRAEVHADPQLLAAAIENIIQNALKFTRRHGHVSLSVREAAGEVLIDVEDECGGLSVGKLDHLFCAFEQHAGDRSGLGLGLSISNASIRAIGGGIHATDLPGKGCIFTVTLPKAP